MFLITFYNSFCSFHKLYILKIGMQLEPEEINWNSELQNKKANRKQRTISQGLRNFAVQNFPTKFCRLAIYLLFLSFCDFFPNYPHVIVFSLYILVICIVLVVYNTKEHFVKEDFN